MAHLEKEIYGLYLSVASTLCASTMGICAKLAGNRGVPVFELVLARSVVLMALTLPQLAHKRINPLQCQRKWMLLLRGLLGFGAVSTFYCAVQYLALADAAVLMFLAPVIVAVLAPLLLKELPSRGVWFAIPLCVLGVVLVSQPTFFFGGSQAISAIGVGLAIAQASFSACAKMCIRALRATEPVQTIVAGMAAVSIVGASMMCAILPDHFVIPGDIVTWLLLFGTGILGFGNQMLSTISLKLSNAAASVAMSYVGVLWSILADLVLFRDAPGALSLAGAAIICCSSYLVVRSEQQRSRARSGLLPEGGSKSYGDEGDLAGSEQAGLLTKQRVSEAEKGLGGGQGEEPVVELAETGKDHWTAPAWASLGREWGQWRAGSGVVGRDTGQNNCWGRDSLQCNSGL